MAATAELLRKWLPDSFTVVSGVRVRFRGRQLLLEHVVTGPTGIFLAASVAENPWWREDLSRAAAFFMDVLGPYSPHFAVLAITGKGPGIGPLPCIRQVESVMDAAVAILQERTEDPLTPEALQEIRERIEARQVRGTTLLERFTWREWVTLGSVAVLTTVMVTDDPEITAWDWLPIFLVLEVPLTAVLWLVNRIPSSRVRAVLSYTIMSLAVVATLFLSLVAYLI